MDAGQQLATVVAIIAAAGLALAPFCKSAVDAIDATGAIPSGWAGVFAILFGAVVGAIVGVLAALMGGPWSWVLLAGIAGAFSGTGAIVTHQAATGATVEKTKRSGAAVVAITTPAAAPSAEPTATPPVAPVAPSDTTVIAPKADAAPTA